MTSTMPFSRVIAVCALFLSAAIGQEAPGLTLQQKEAFLLKAKIVKTYDVKKGVTQTQRVTLSDGTMTHDASVQKIDDFQQMFSPVGGKPEMNFKDTYRFNIVAWKVGLLLGLDDMMPPSVDRSSSAFTWWVDNVMMDEQERLEKKLASPDQETWRSDTNTMYVFDQLIANTDRNQGNMLIDKNWRLWLIDHSRAFRPAKELRNAKLLFRVDRGMLAKMKELNGEMLKKEVGRYLGKIEIDGILARRDAIVSYFETKGEDGLMDRPARAAN